MLRTARNGLPACDWRIWSVWRSLFVNSGSRTEATFFSPARMRFCALITAASVWTGLRDLSPASRIFIFCSFAPAQSQNESDKAISEENWISTWGCAPAFPIGQEMANQTLRQFVRISVGGQRVRI